MMDLNIQRLLMLWVCYWILYNNPILAQQKNVILPESNVVYLYQNIYNKDDLYIEKISVLENTIFVLGIYYNASEFEIQRDEICSLFDSLVDSMDPMTLVLIRFVVEGSRIVGEDGSIIVDIGLEEFSILDSNKYQYGDVILKDKGFIENRYVYSFMVIENDNSLVDAVEYDFSNGDWFTRLFFREQKDYRLLFSCKHE